MNEIQTAVLEIFWKEDMVSQGDSLPALRFLEINPSLDKIYEVCNSLKQEGFLAIHDLKKMETPEKIIAFTVSLEEKGADSIREIEKNKGFKTEQG